MNSTLSIDNETRRKRRRIHNWGNLLDVNGNDRKSIPIYPVGEIHRWGVRVQQ